MQQRSFGSVEYEHKKVKTRRQAFLDAWTGSSPGLSWSSHRARLPEAVLQTPPLPAARDAAHHCLQLWFNLSDPGMSRNSVRARVRRSQPEPIPDETRSSISATCDQQRERTINGTSQAGLQVCEGTIVDSTIISAPSSTKNRERARDPEMHQTRTGRQWYFGMKLHSGTDARTGLVHSLQHDGGERLRRDRGASSVARS